MSSVFGPGAKRFIVGIIAELETTRSGRIDQRSASAPDNINNIFALAFGVGIVTLMSEGLALDHRASKRQDDADVTDAAPTANLPQAEQGNLADGSVERFMGWVTTTAI